MSFHINAFKMSAKRPLFCSYLNVSNGSSSVHKESHINLTSGWKIYYRNPRWNDFFPNKLSRITLGPWLGKLIFILKKGSGYLWDWLRKSSSRFGILHDPLDPNLKSDFIVGVILKEYVYFTLEHLPQQVIYFYCSGLWYGCRVCILFTWHRYF